MVKTDESVCTAENNVDNTVEGEDSQIDKEPVVSFEYDLKNEEE